MTTAALKTITDLFDFDSAFSFRPVSIETKFPRTLKVLRANYRVPAALELFYLAVAIEHTECHNSATMICLAKPLEHIRSNEAETVEAMLKLDQRIANHIGDGEMVSHYFMQRVMSFGRKEDVTLNALAWLIYLAHYAGVRRAQARITEIYRALVINKRETQFMQAYAGLELNGDQRLLLENATNMILQRMNQYV